MDTLGLQQPVEGNSMHSEPRIQTALEVVDIKNQPLGVFPEKQVHFHGLFHRSVAVAVYDRQSRIYLRKRNGYQTLYPDRWDLPASGHVLAGEAVYEAARRKLKERAGLSLAGLRLVSLIEGCRETNCEFIYVFNAGRVRRFPGYGCEDTQIARLNPRDLTRLVQENPETMTPWLVFLWKLELLFR